jgi:hypothetical protein
MSDTIKAVMATDLLTEHILGVVPNKFTAAEEAEFVKEIEQFYGFPCAVFELKEIK